jgi:hypothetical protein
MYNIYKKKLKEIYSYYLMSVTDTFRINVRDWIAYDNKITKANSAIKRVKEKKETIATNIIQFMDANNLQKKEIKISNSRLQYKTTTKTSPLTRKFITEKLTEFLGNEKDAKEAAKRLYDVRRRMELCLTEYFEDEDKAIEAVEYLYKNRNKKVMTTIKRKIQREPVDIEEGPVSSVAQSALESD